MIARRADLFLAAAVTKKKPKPLALPPKTPRGLRKKAAGRVVKLSEFRSRHGGGGE